MANYPRKLIICEGLVVIYFLASRTITKTFSKFDFLQSVQMGYFLLSIVLKIVLDQPVQPKTKHQSSLVKTPKSIKTYQKPEKTKNPNKKQFINCTGFYHHAFKYLF